MSHASGGDMQQSLLSAPHDSSQPNYQSIQPSQPSYAPSHPSHPPPTHPHPAYYPIPPTIPLHLQHRYRATQLPPYPKYTSLKQQFFALSRINQAFLIIVALLWPLTFLPSSTRLVALFLPLLFVPSTVLYFVYVRCYEHVEINLLMHTYVTAFTVGALIVLLLESLLTLIFASVTLYWQMDEVAKWLLQQGGTTVTDGGDASDPFAFLSKTAGFFIFIFLVAFVVAGCVEESMKYALTIRIKRVTPGFADRTGFLLYAVTAALGFSTLENIGYAFQVTTPALAVLLNVASRVLISTPLHIGCGYLTGIGVVRRDVYGEPLPLWRIMGLPVLLHGGFDFFLILAASLMADDWPLLGVELAVVVVAFSAIGVAIRLEKRHINGPPPVLPTVLSGVAADDSGAVVLLPPPHQPSVAVTTVSSEDSRPQHRAEREGDVLV